MKLVTRKEKISMFLKEYYFGYGILGSINRALVGLGLVGVGIYLYLREGEENDWIYAIICLVFGILSIIKPYMAVKLNKKSFEDEKLNVSVDSEGINIEDGNNYVSQLVFTSFLDLKERKSYIAIIFNKKQRIQIPKRLFSESDLEILRQRFN